MEWDGELQYVAAVDITQHWTFVHVLVFKCWPKCVALAALHCYSQMLLSLSVQLFFIGIAFVIPVQSQRSQYALLSWSEWRKMTSSLSLFVSLCFFSLMDREVTLLGEMDKVKAESSKCFLNYVNWTMTCRSRAIWAVVGIFLIMWSPDSGSDLGQIPRTSERK